MFHAEVHQSALKRDLDIDDVVRMWNEGNNEVIIDDAEPPRYMRLVFDGEGRPWELTAQSFGNGTRYLIINAMPARKSVIERMQRRR